MKIHLLGKKTEDTTNNIAKEQMTNENCLPS